jgi:hypothetical protein
MKTSVFYFTDNRCYTAQEAIDELRCCVSTKENWEILRSNITRQDTACHIDGFLEIKGELFVLLGDVLHSPGFILC